MQRRERIVGDLRPRRRDRGKKSRLAGVGQADKAEVGDQLQPQEQRALDARLAGIGASRRLIGRSGEMGVAEAAVAALGDDDPLAGRLEVGERPFQVFFVVDLRAFRHLQHRVGAAAAGAVLAHAVHAGLGLEVLLVAEVDQRVEAAGAFDHDIAAAAAVAAVGAAELDELLAAERHAAGPAVAGAYVDAGLIKELHGDPSLSCARQGRRGARSRRRATRRSGRRGRARRAPARPRARSRRRRTPISPAHDAKRCC